MNTIIINSYWAGNHCEALNQELYMLYLIQAIPTTTVSGRHHNYSYFTEKNKLRLKKVRSLSEGSSWWKSQDQMQVVLISLLIRKPTRLITNGILSDVGKSLLLCWKSELSWLTQCKNKRAAVICHARNEHPRGWASKWTVLILSIAFSPLLATWDLAVLCVLTNPILPGTGRFLRIK